MKVQGCLLSQDKTDKILLNAQLDPENCHILLSDNLKRPLGQCSIHIHEGELFLTVVFASHLNCPVGHLKLATL